MKLGEADIGASLEGKSRNTVGLLEKLIRTCFFGTILSSPFGMHHTPGEIGIVFCLLTQMPPSQVVHTIEV